jgi:hypothetical protein
MRNGGERGIRTPDTVSRIHAFEARAFSHSAISPQSQRVSASCHPRRQHAYEFCFFFREKQYLENVSTNTLRWYRHALKWLPCENPNEQELSEMILRMREKGMKAYGLQCCNSSH